MQVITAALRVEPFMHLLQKGNQVLVAAYQFMVDSGIQFYEGQ